jgi:hypothetical protein
VAAYRKADRLAPNHPLIREQLAVLEGVLRLERKLDACLAGTAQPANPREALWLAFRAAEREHYHTAVRFCSEAFQKEPNLSNDLLNQARYNAACWAALTVAGKGRDADTLTEKDRASLRQQALEWLRADLAAYRGLLARDPKYRPAIQQVLAHWPKDPELSNLRDTAAIERLPEAEREPWRQLWADARALYKRIQDR